MRQINLTQWFLVAYLMSCSLVVNAADLKMIDFYNDEMQKTLELPDPTCVCLIDDEQSYTASKMGDRKVQITAKGNNERSATLMLDCPGSVVVYALRYFGRKKYGSISSQAWKDWPAAHVELSGNYTSSGASSRSFEFMDRSEPYFQFSGRESLFLGPEIRSKIDSVDFAHEGDTWRLGYGADRVLSVSEKKVNYRVSLGLGDVSVSHSTSTEIKDQKQSRVTWMRVPVPLNLNLGYQQKFDGSEVGVVDRFFFANFDAVMTSAITRYIMEKDYLGNVTQTAKIRIDQNLRRLPLNPSMSNTIACRALERCFLTNLSFRVPIYLVRTSIIPEYAPLPHTATLRISSEFGDGHSINFGLKHVFKRESFVRHWRFAAREKTESITDDLSVLHLESTVRNITYFAEQSFSVLEKAVGGTGIGLQYVGEKINGGIRVFKERSQKSPVQAFLDLRYYIDKNLRSATIRLAQTKIRVKVLSNAEDKPVVGAKVLLFRSGELVDSAETSNEGEVNFTKTNCCGDFDIRASFKEFGAEGQVHLSASALEASATLYLEDHRQVQVDYYLKNSGSSFERVYINNFYPEIGDAIIGYPDAVYEGNNIYVPIYGENKPFINDVLLPFKYRLISIDGGDLDSKQRGPGRVRVVLEENSP